MTTEELREKELVKELKLKHIQECNESLFKLAINGYVSKGQYKRINKKIHKAFLKANKPLYENETIVVDKPISITDFEKMIQNIKENK